MNQEQLKQRLLVLKQWLDEGLISEEEYKHEKTLCLEQLRQAGESGQHGGDFFATTGASAGGDAFLTGGGQDTQLATPGAIFGHRYRLESLLGRGGMGEVWKAQDQQTHASVALKHLPQVLQSQPDLQRRFQREMEVLLQLEHPNIVKLLDISPQEHFFVMELLEGRDLHEWLQEHQRLALHDAVRLLLQLADALETAHARGIVHRDLKPHNLFLCGNDLRQLKLLDFGIARVHEGTRVTQTQSGSLGSAYYMAPEQLDGKSDNIGPATDLYACGILLYEILTGRLPQPGAPTLQQELLRQWASEVSPTLSERQLKEQATALDELYRRLVSSFPDARGSLTHLKRDLRDWLYWHDRDNAPSAYEGLIKASVQRHQRPSTSEAVESLVNPSSQTTASEKTSQSSDNAKLSRREKKNLQQQKRPKNPAVLLTVILLLLLFGGVGVYWLLAASPEPPPPRTPDSTLLIPRSSSSHGRKARRRNAAPYFKQRRRRTYRYRRPTLQQRQQRRRQNSQQRAPYRRSY
jgi:serine/threonine protein kinase